MAKTISLAKLNPTTAPFTKVRVQTTAADIHKSACGEPAHCMGAVAINREAGLGGHGYIQFEANEVRFTNEGFRFVLRPFRDALEMLRDFDELGDTIGQAEARDRMDARAFTLELISIAKIPPKASRERKDQINRRRNARAAQRRQLGLPACEPVKRYSGVRIHGKG